MRRFTVAIDEKTAERLTALARIERRDPRDQAALLLEKLFIRGGRHIACRPALNAAGDSLPSPTPEPPESVAP